MSITIISFREYKFSISEIMIKSVYRRRIHMEFHERLKAVREDRDIKQNEAAEKVGIKNNTLSSYESGSRKPDYDTLIKLADLYGVSVEYLLRGKKEQSEDSGSLFFFDTEGLSKEEIDDIKRHIEFVKWKAKSERS